MTSKRQTGPSDKVQPVVTIADLRAAYVREAPYRPHWPRDFDSANADPLIHRLLYLFACRVPAIVRRRAERGHLGMIPRELEAVDAPAPAREFRSMDPTRPVALDRKRLASGEREDD